MLWVAYTDRIHLVLGAVFTVHAVSWGLGYRQGCMLEATRSVRVRIAGLACTGATFMGLGN